MSTETAVQAIYLEREMVRVEFANSSIVIDHPSRTGGLGKGPTPGELVAAGMTAASVFSALDAAKLLGLRLNSIVARSAHKAAREGKEGPLHALAFITRVWRHLELEGLLKGINGPRLAGRVGILETLRNGVDLTERVSFSDPGISRGIVAPKNPSFLEHEKAVAVLAPGARMEETSIEPRWKVNATPLDSDTVIVELAGVALCVSRTGEPRRGPTPHELLLGGLAACTAIYVGRNSPVHAIPLQRVEVTAVADTPHDLLTPIRAIDKVTHIIGKLTDGEKEKCKFFADFCAWGETLKRGVEIVDTIVTKDAPQSSDIPSPFADLARACAPPEQAVT